jgi:hypothetical protein
MFVELITMLPGDEEPIARWELQLAMSNVQQTFAARWDELSRRIVEEQNRDRHVQPEVFLCLREPEIGSNYGRLRELFDMAHGHIRGAPLYLVISSTIGQAGTLVEEESTLNLWFETVERNATDLIQFPLPHYQHRRPVHVNGLSKKADESRRRQTFIEQLIHQEALSHWENNAPLWPWRQVSLPIPTENDPLWSLFSAAHEVQDFNKIFLVGPEGQSRTMLEDKLKQTKASHPHRNKRLPRQIVIPWLEELTPDFRQFCTEQGLSIAPMFSGACEIRFFLQRLNEHAAGYASTEAMVRTVERKREHEVFAPHERRHSPSLLLTSAFHQDDQGHFSAVRKEISDIVRLAWQASVTPITHNAVDVGRLRYVLSSANTPRHLTVWLHLGHGGEDGGLREYSQSFRDAAEWLACFSGLPEKRSLSLAFFSACHSVAIAQRFVEAGAGVAIGFERKVDPATCQQISVPVIHAAWKTNGNQVAILEAFRRAVAVPTSGIRQAKPWAFHA